MTEKDPHGTPPHHPGAKAILTKERVHELLLYCPETGRFTRRIGVRGYAAGAEVGSVHIHGGCRYVALDGRKYKEHRLIWLYVYGHFPEHEIDHINGDGTDNRLDNLRLATHAENSQNRRLHRDSLVPYLGVTHDRKRGQFQARIMVAGRQIHLGRFSTAEGAHEAYRSAKASLHTFSPEVRT